MPVFHQFGNKTTPIQIAIMTKDTVITVTETVSVNGKRKRNINENVHTVMEFPGGWEVQPLVHVYRRSFLSENALNFNPCETFQTFRHLTTSSFRLIPF